MRMRLKVDQRELVVKGTGCCFRDPKEQKEKKRKQLKMIVGKKCKTVKKKNC